MMTFSAQIGGRVVRVRNSINGNLNFARDIVAEPAAMAPLLAEDAPGAAKIPLVVNDLPSFLGGVPCRVRPVCSSPEVRR
jgi:hypothetical protein